MKKCSRCKEYKDLTEFTKDKNRKDGLDYWCKSCCKKQARIYYQKYREKLLERVKLYRKINRAKINQYDRNYRKFNANFKLAGNLRRRITKSLKFKSKSKSTLELLGCSIDFLKKHLESKFKEGMSWNNYGKWHIDHIKPCCSFDLTKESEQRECFHYTNLQPLWAKENLSKGTYAKY